MVEKIREEPAKLGPELKKFLKNENKPKKWTSIEALAEFFDSDKSVSEFRAYRENVNKSAGINAMPCWDILYTEKIKMSPDRRFITQTVNRVLCPMQEVRYFLFSLPLKICIFCRSQKTFMI